MKTKKMNTKQLWLAGIFFLSAVVLALVNIQSQTWLLLIRMAGLACVFAAIMLAAAALRGWSTNIKLENFNQSARIRNPLPPPPEIPAGMDAMAACTGSLRGALRGIQCFWGKFTDPVQMWQLERSCKALDFILKRCEAGADPNLCLDFATQYLPSAMQYVAACAAEGSPANGTDTLCHVAAACEKQQDAMAAVMLTEFEQEYVYLRTALEKAEFYWEKE